ncbi:hypothetical protein MKW94_019510 [Papaver nudicaule]|uniref:Phytocyanin domain-containing protein n=1 Tax=Papaver nudicaule TaxID=74823 RepID=A0AA41V5L6_PAPNU|nr:hypothetical protein [Papaver nudicaule]
MSSSKTVVFFVIALIAVFNVASSMAATYDVGDDFGWTCTKHSGYVIPGSVPWDSMTYPSVPDVDYEQWSYARTFHAGDIIRFIYYSRLGPMVQVNQVTQSDYERCDWSHPLATYTSGNDSITITGDETDYYFISGLYECCHTGMKVHIHVTDPNQVVPASAPVSYQQFDTDQAPPPWISTTRDPKERFPGIKY